MEALIKITENNKEVITSLEIAEITGKEHKNVMRDIRNMLEKLDNEDALNFELVDYKDAKGETRPCYAMTKKGSLCLASGYDANLRMKIINRWEELEMKERAMLPATYKDALLALVAKIEEQEKTQALLEAKEEELDESKDWYTIKRRAISKGVNWHVYNWRAMKHLSSCLGKEVKKAFDANYGQVNLYHISVFEAYERSAKIN